MSNTSVVSISSSAFVRRSSALSWSVTVDGEPSAWPSRREAMNARSRSENGYAAASTGDGILTGIEAGEAHLFAGSLAGVLGQGTFQRVLGSLHAVPDGGRLNWLHMLYERYDPSVVVEMYFEELLRLVEGSAAFEVLAHADLPRRSWSSYARGPYREKDFEDAYRTVFRALAASGRVLEVNTRSPLVSTNLLRWWHEEGGGAVSFGSDAHQAYRVGARFDQAVAIAEAAGFTPGRDRYDFWRR